MTHFQKPMRLKPGDTVAVLSPSWGGPSVYPHVFDLGLTNLRELLGVEIQEYSTTRMDADELHKRPQQRAEDLNAAFADPEVKAIISSIGGDDSVRLLPFLDAATIAANPKIFMGFSDTTTLLTFAHQQGLTEPADRYEYAPYAERVVAFQDWSAPGYTGEVTFASNDGWRRLQGEGIAQGQLFGGNIEVLEFLKGTAWWPSADFWQGKLLFFETSEEKPTPDQVKYMLRNYGMQGIFDQIAGLLFARPQFYTMEERETLHRTIVSVVAGEFERPALPIVAEMDFGHEAPQSILPLGVTAETDCMRGAFRLLEACVQ